MMDFPMSARVYASPKLAADLLCVVTKLPPYDDQSLYDVKLQAAICNEIRSGCADGFDGLIEEIRVRLIQAPYCVCVTGLRFDESNLLFVALSGVFGHVVDPYNQPWSKLVRYIRPSTDRSVSSWGVLNEQLHTDGTDWPQPNDLTCLLCIRPDQNGGGRSRLLDIDTLHAELKTTVGAEVISILYEEPVPWRNADELGGGVTWAPIFTSNTLRWLRYTIDIALNEGLQQLSEPVSMSVAALAAVSDLFKTTPRKALININ